MSERERASQEKTVEWERGWRSGVEAYRQAVRQGTAIRPLHPGVEAHVANIDVRGPISAADFGGFLAGWLAAEEMITKTLEQLGEGPAPP